MIRFLCENFVMGFVLNFLALRFALNFLHGV